MDDSLITPLPIEHKKVLDVVGNYGSIVSTGIAKLGFVAEASAADFKHVDRVKQSLAQHLSQQRPDVLVQEQ